MYPHVYTVAKMGFDRYRPLSRPVSRPGGFLERVADVARRQKISEAEIENWKTRVPAALAAAAQRGEFNGSLLSYGLLRPAYWTDALDLDRPEAIRQWEATVQILREIIRGSRIRGIDVALIFIPCIFQYDPVSHSAEANHPWVVSGVEVRKQWLTRSSEVQKRLEAFTESQDVPFLDLTNTFRTAARVRDGLHFKLDDHWTQQGHIVAAHAIASWLVSEEVFQHWTRFAPDD